MQPSMYFLAGSMSNDTDLGRSFNKLMAETFINYEGCLIEKTRNGYKVLGKDVKDIEAAKKVIQSSKESLSKSIK